MKKILYLVLFLLIGVACSQKDSESNENNILTFGFKGVEPIDSILIDSNSIWIRLPENTDITSLTPEFDISANATVTPKSGIAQNFTNPVEYIVTSESGNSKTYKVNVLTEDNFTVTNFAFPDIYVTGVISGHNIVLTVPYGTNTKSLRPVFSLRDSTLISSIRNGVKTDFENPVEWKLSAGGLSETYHITVKVSNQETGVRAVWVTNVSSTALFSESNLDSMVAKLADLNFNTICVSVYNKGQTLFPSETLAKVLGKTASEVVYDDCRWGDVLGRLIEKAHAKNIKVIAWFEYGFASHYSGLSAPVLNAKPEWISKDIDGNQTQKNNFYWLNGFHPEVQQFLTDMIVECVRKYQVDGIQGDDRLPAMPSSAGYDDYTKQLYFKETGNVVPDNPKESKFFNWKVNKMTAYAIALYKTVKAIRSSCLVTWAPSTQGWAKDNYLQDWPAWVRNGAADYVSPQLYRTEAQGIGTYSTLVYNDLTTVFTTQALLTRYVPGMLVKNGIYMPSDDFLVQMIKYHRSLGIYSESTWFYEAVVSKQKVFKVLYPGPAIFPSY